MVRTLRSVLSFRVALRFLRGSWSRLAFCLCALGAAVALVCALDLVNRAVYRAFAEVIDTMAGRASLQVSTGESGLFSEDLATAIAAVPGVELAIPVVAATAFTVEEKPESLTVHAFDLGNENAVRVYQSDKDDGLEVEDPLVFLNQPDSIMVPRMFAERRGLREESHLVLDTPTGRRTFTVRGLLEPTGIARAFDGRLIVMDVFAAEEAFTKRGYVNRVDIVVDREADPSAVAVAVRAVLPAGLEVQTPSQRKADLHAVMRSLQALLQGLSLVALVAAGLIAFSRLSVMFEERAWQIGVMRALGARRKVVWRELVKEGLLLAFGGIALGIPGGILLGRAILPAVAATTALDARIVAPRAALSVQPISLLLAVLVGLGAALAAALLPAWRASGVSVAEVLRGRGIEMPAWTGRGVTAARAALLAAVAVAVGLAMSARGAVWSMAATILLVLAAKSIAAPVLQLATRGALGQKVARLGAPSRLVLGNLTRNPRRSGLLVATVGIGLGTVVWLTVVAHSFETSLTAVFGQAMRADLVVSSSHVGAALLEQPVDDRLAAALKGIDRVESVVGIRLVNWGYQGGPIVIDAFDPEYFRDPSFGEWPLLGKRAPNAWEAVARGEGVVISTSFVHNLGVHIGDRLTLETPNGPLSLDVVGVTTDFASPRGTVEMSRELYKRHWNDPTVTRFFVRTATGSDPELVTAEIHNRLGGEDRAWRIISAANLVRHFGSQVRRAFVPVYVLAAVILAVIVFGMMDNLSAGVAERTWEIGMLGALGVRRRRMRLMLVAEALMICVLGFAVALVLGLVVGALWVNATIPGLLGWVIELRFPLLPVSGIFAVALASAALAALVPARRIASLDPATALRWE